MDTQVNANTKTATLSGKNRYEDLINSKRKPEGFVRRGLALLEIDFRGLALLSLADWESLAIPKQELFWSIASMQKPSWGTWNGLLDALRNARKSALRTADVEKRRQIENAATLNDVISFLNEKVDDKLADSARDLAKFTNVSIEKTVTYKSIFALPITLRNRVAHDNPLDPEWWKDAQTRLRPFIQFHARSNHLQTIKNNSNYSTPWFITNKKKLCTYNGLRTDLSANYVSPEGSSTTNSKMGGEVLLSFQRLLGKTEIQETDFRKLMTKLAPEEAKGVIMGDFLVGKPVGSGGFGTVHLGWQLSTGRKVAIKILHDNLSEDSKLRFQKEAEYLSQFDHSNIVRIIGYSEEPWSQPRHYSLSEEEWFAKFSNSARVKCFIAMEWIEGKTLEELYQDRGGNFPSTDVIAEWFSQTANALKTVHSTGLIHRDIKPNNLMISWDGVIKLMDFGIARTQDETRTLMTSVGEIIGTPVYMSPEQIRKSIDSDAEVGPGTDIYSLCATFYELFTRKRLFDHNSLDIEKIKKLKLNGVLPTKPRQYVSQLPWEIETILIGGLQPEISDRYKSMASLEQDLQNYLNNKPIEYKKPFLARRLQLLYRRNKSIFNIAAVFLIAVIIGAAFYIWSIKQEQANTLKQLMTLYEEQGWQELRNGKPLRASVYLSEAYSNGNNSVAVRFMLAQALLTIDSQITTLKGHSKGIYSTAFSPNGQFIITAGFDDKLKVWNVAQGSLITTVEINPQSGMEDFWSYEISPSTFSKDIKRIVIPSSNNNAEIVDIDNGEHLLTLFGHTSNVTSAEYSPDGVLILTSSSDNTAIIWDAFTGKKIIQVRHDRLSRASFSPDGKFFLTLSSSPTDHGLKIWGIDGGLIQSIKGYKYSIQSASFSPDSKQIITSGDDADINSENLNNSLTFWEELDTFDNKGNKPSVKIWDVNSGQQILEVKGHDQLILSAEFSPNGLLFVTSSLDSTAKVWRTTDGKLISTLEGHTSWLTDAKFSPNNKRILTVSDDNTVRIWDSINGQSLAILEGHTDSVSTASFSPDGKTIITSSDDGTTKIWKAKDKLLYFQNEENTSIAAISHDNQRMVTINQTDKVIKRSIDKLKKVETVSTSYKEIGKVIDIETGKLLFYLQIDVPSKNVINKIEFSRDGKFIIGIGNFKTGRKLKSNHGFLYDEHVASVTSWNANNGRIVKSVYDPNLRTTNLTTEQISPDGNFILFLGENRKLLKVWGTYSGKDVCIIKETDSDITSVRFSPDNRFILTTSLRAIENKWEDTISIWDIKSGTLLKKWELPIAVNKIDNINDYQGGGDTVPLADFSPDGQRIISLQGGINPSVWETTTGKLLFNLQGHTDDVRSAEFSANGKYIVTTGVDNTVRIWDAENGRNLKIIEIPSPNSHMSSFNTILSPNGEFLLIQQEMGATQLYDTASSKILMEINPKMNFDNVRFASFSSDSQRILIINHSGAVRIWDIHLESRPSSQVENIVSQGSPFRLDNGGLISTFSLK